MSERALWLARDWIEDVAAELKRIRRHCEEQKYRRQDANYGPDYEDAHRLTTEAIDRAIAALGLVDDTIIKPMG